MQGKPCEVELSSLFSDCFLPLTIHCSYCKFKQSLSSLSSFCRGGVGPRLPLLRKFRAGREAFPGRGPREEEEAEEVEAEGSGATVALTLLLDPSWRFGG